MRDNVRNEFYFWYRSFNKFYLVMAVPRQEYLDFVALVNPEGGTLRDAIWGHLFPENINTRDPVLYEFKVASPRVLFFLDI